MPEDTSSCQEASTESRSSLGPKPLPGFQHYAWNIYLSNRRRGGRYPYMMSAAVPHLLFRDRTYIHEALYTDYTPYLLRAPTVTELGPTDPVEATENRGESGEEHENDFKPEAGESDSFKETETEPSAEEEIQSPFSSEGWTEEDAEYWYTPPTSGVADQGDFGNAYSSPTDATDPTVVTSQIGSQNAPRGPPQH